jgi:hypothetical protein
MIVPDLRVFSPCVAECEVDSEGMTTKIDDGPSD